MTTPRLVLNLTVYTADGDATVHHYDWPDDRESQVALRRDLTRKVQAGFLDQTVKGVDNTYHCGGGMLYHLGDA